MFCKAMEGEKNIERGNGEKGSAPFKEGRPLGVIILGGFNFFVLGITSFVFFFFAYQSISSPEPSGILEQAYQKDSDSFGESLFRDVESYFPEGALDRKQFKIALLLQMAVAFVFCVSGLGILLRKEEARRLTVYFSFLVAVFALLSVAFRASGVTQAALQVIYPGVLIFYFTSKRAERYFSSVKKSRHKGDN